MVLVRGILKGVVPNPLTLARCHKEALCKTEMTGATAIICPYGDCVLERFRECTVRGKSSYCKQGEDNRVTETGELY